ncbi:MAG TPA: ParB/RepB/Spo0J family partition protein [Azospirillaceae bacterium]|nr:ParB/RepB/Spo0J family partition protein [Azospirillaceae bacterium]
MSAEDRKRGLGRGLSALFGDDGAETDGEAPRTLPIEFLQPGKYQPRRRFDEAAVASLAESVRERGVLQPLLVRKLGPDRYEIIAGERRWRASQMAGLHEVPVLVRELDDRQALEVALVENVQREDLTPIEEAEGYKRLMDEFDHTQEELARTVGKSRSHIANMLRLLALPDPVKALIADGEITAGHARALLTLPDPVAAAKEVVRRGLNVRQTELLARQGTMAEETGGAGRRNGGAAKDADTEALERELALALGLKVAISHAAKGGTLTIHYKDLDQLDGVIARLRG